MTKFIVNPNWKPEIQQERPFRQGMGKITVGVSESIKTAALPFRDTGNYIDRIGIRTGHPTHVELERHFAHIIELGSVNNPPQHNVRRGIRSAGLRYEDTGPKQAN
jgi:hypothetical protein